MTIDFGASESADGCVMNRVGSSLVAESMAVRVFIAERLCGALSIFEIAVQRVEIAQLAHFDVMLRGFNFASRRRLRQGLKAQRS